MNIQHHFDCVYESVLNVGCGYAGFRHGFLETLNECPIRVGIEIVQDKIDSWNGSGWDIIKHDLNIPLPNTPFEVVVAFDIIEHLPKERGITLIEEIENIATKLIAIFAPIGWLDTGELQPEYVHTTYDLHKSSWYPEDFVLRGYDVQVLENLHNIKSQKFGAFFAHKHMEA